jgi:hypothetical protein
MPFTAEDIYDDDTVREKYLQKIYNKILDECCTFIYEVHHRVRKNEIIYNIPYGYPGEEDFDFLACIVYIIKQLRESGFYVRYVYPNTLYISWLNKEKEYKKLNNLKRLLLEDVLTVKTINEPAKKQSTKLLEYK